MRAWCVGRGVSKLSQTKVTALVIWELNCCAFFYAGTSFKPCEKDLGPIEGWVFKDGRLGKGYYTDPGVAPAERMQLTVCEAFWCFA
jgi:hypothetical protein